MIDSMTLGHSWRGTKRINTVTDACPHCRYGVPQSRAYLMRNHLERVHKVHHHVQLDTTRKPSTVPSPAVPASVFTSVSNTMPSVSSPGPSPDHNSRSQLTPFHFPSLDIFHEPVEITTKDHDLLSYVVRTSGIFDPQGKLSREIFPLEIYEVGSSLRPTHEITPSAVL